MTSSIVVVHLPRNEGSSEEQNSRLKRVILFLKLLPIFVGAIIIIIAFIDNQCFIIQTMLTSQDIHEVR